MMKRLTLGAFLILFLASCGQGKQPTKPPEPTATQAALPTRTPTQPPTAIRSLATSTATSLPPTATPTQASVKGILEATVTIPPAPTNTPVPIITYGPDNFPAGINPLTGLKVADPALLERYPIGVKVSMYPRYVRPPWGLSLADIVYDYYQNGGYTRLFALFYGNDADYIGPIRSGRLFDKELVSMYKSIFAYGSADARINNKFFSSSFANRLVLEGAGAACPPKPATPLCRYDPSGGDYLLGSTQAITDYIVSRGVAKARQNLDGMFFNSQAPAGGTPGTQVSTRYSGDSYNRWDYDPATGRYLRLQDNVYDQGQGEEYAPLTDRLNNQPITADNVVVLMIRHDYFDRAAEIVDVMISDGKGKAYAFRDGQVYEVTWNRPTVDSVPYLTFPDGTRYPFKPGNTWFQVVGESSAVTSKDGIWRFEFRIP